MVQERHVVEKIETHYVDDFSARLVFLIGLVGIGTGVAVLYPLLFLENLVRQI